MDTLIPILIYIVTPIVGFILFIKTLIKLSPIQKTKAFTLKLFLSFSILGGLLLLFLTILFWKWSGMASIGSIFLILFAPIIMGVIGFESYRKLEIDSGEKILFRFSIAYFIFLPIILALAFFTDT